MDTDADPVENRGNDEEEENDEDNHYEYGDGFLADSDDGEEEEEEEEKQCSDDDEDFSLHEDDYQLIQENNASSQKFKRLKKSSEEHNDGTYDDDDVEEDELRSFIIDEDDGRVMECSKKRKYKQGISSDYFGDPEKFLKLRKKDLAMERKLEDEFEPTLLSDKYMTGRDEEIRKLDVPERMQLSEEETGTVPVDEASIEEESNWIYAQLNQESSVEKDDISRFLELFHVQKLEIPFIVMYRKEQCQSLLKSETKLHKVLWMIQDLDKKWLLLRKRKTALLGYYTKRFQEEEEFDLNQSLIKSLNAAETEREVDDVDSMFSLHFPLGQYKRPNRTSQYSFCVKSGLRDVVSKLGFSAERLGLALSLEKVLVDDELEDAKETPEEIAFNYVSPLFQDAQAVLKGARHVAAVEISCDASIKKYVRRVYMENAVVSTSPTLDGNVIIDSCHRFSSVKWLREKPLSKFDGAQWLLIQRAEE
ncbi:unnamed protein product [Microthlaspi erraticum]|uniref:Uncharacterized protein n=1 Tax=Microthlaspi erraticum TaxID=1685480 RepID=A0A6D2JBP6_9BRAS|nr:unnamed protein product [Microthlaspi erraticum]